MVLRKPGSGRGTSTREQDVQYTARMKDLPTNARPRERLLELGASALSDAELLAIVLRTGNQQEMATTLAGNILGRFRGLSGLLRASTSELCDVYGVGPAKAAEIKAALELGRRLHAAGGNEDRFQIRSPEDVAHLLQVEMAALDQEQLRVVLLDTKNRVVTTQTVYQGSVNTSQVRIAEIFKEAVRQNLPSLVVVHNHPSGDPTPSREDIRVTQDLVQAGKLLCIEVLDHLVIGAERYVSLKERGLGFG
ncbi:MAG: JAB domain-containing protein [Chloroflexota bacterium]|nr:MAG: JAB domain-containing protein [Chloroflexota bacterium]